MNILVRSETPADYSRIAEINARAFGPGTAMPPAYDFVPEVALVDMARHNPQFDPELALVACVQDRVIGQALFNPLTMYIGGEVVPAVLLAPLVVDVDWQRQGVGTLLMREGHRRAAERGYALSFLWGHPSYYPRFGYQSRMFGASTLTVSIPSSSTSLTARPFVSTDVPVLEALWRTWFSDVDLAVDPGTSLLGWMSHTSSIRASVFERAGQIVGYARYNLRPRHGTSPQVILFLAADADAAASMVAWLAPEGSKELVLPLASGSCALRSWFGNNGRIEQTAWDACMIALLDADCVPAAEYVRDIVAGARLIGLPIMPPYLEVT